MPFSFIHRFELLLEQLNRLTANAIMDLYPETLDPEYDPKKKKQTVKNIISKIFFSNVCSFSRLHRKLLVN